VPPIEALHTAYGKLEDAIDTFNAEVAELRGPVEDAVNAYNEALERRCALLNVRYAPIATKFRVAAK